MTEPEHRDASGKLLTVRLVRELLASGWTVKEIRVGFRYKTNDPHSQARFERLVEEAEMGGVLTPECYRDREAYLKALDAVIKENRWLQDVADRWRNDQALEKLLEHLHHERSCPNRAGARQTS